MKWSAVKKNPYVLLPQGNIAGVSASDIEHVIRLAEASPRKRARICLHQTSEDLQQEMVIAFGRTAYVQPHRQLEKTKTYVVLRGSLNLFFFSEKGKIKQSILLDSTGKKGPSLFRFPAWIWHTFTICGKNVVILEITRGPFQANTTHLAPWSAAESNHQGMRAFNKKLKQHLAAT